MLISLVSSPVSRLLFYITFFKCISSTKIQSLLLKPYKFSVKNNLFYHLWTFVNFLQLFLNKNVAKLHAFSGHVGKVDLCNHSVAIMGNLGSNQHRHNKKKTKPVIQILNQYHWITILWTIPLSHKPLIWI